MHCFRNVALAVGSGMWQRFKKYHEMTLDDMVPLSYLWWKDVEDALHCFACFMRVLYASDFCNIPFEKEGDPNTGGKYIFEATTRKLFSSRVFSLKNATKLKLDYALLVVRTKEMNQNSSTLTSPVAKDSPVFLDF